MPYKLLKHNGKYSVENKNTHHLFSKGTTFGKAKAQMRLLYSKEPKLIKKYH
jgi:hypothetical protein